ncbi:acyl-peptide hydrolase [Luteimonas sp. FCS-9]|nr:acyl-peptide hydrolase [Luteimonas sp. FCS-9]
MVCAATGLHEDPRYLQPRDLFDLEWADAPALSPDGRQVIYQRQGYDILRDRRLSRLWLLDVDSGRQVPLGEDAAGSNATWSPDGSRVAWIARNGERAQIMVRWKDGGRQVALGWLPQPPSDLSWSPDGRRIAFTMAVEADTEPQIKLPSKPEGAEWAPQAKYIDRVGYRADGAGYTRPGYRHVFVIPADGGTPRQVSRGDFSHRSPVWDRDGRSLYVVSNQSPEWEYQPRESEIYRLDLASGAVAALTDRRGPDEQPVLSPDGRQLAYVGYDDERKGHQVTHLYLLDLQSGRSRALTADFDYPVADPQWDRNGRGLYFSYEREGRGHIAWIDAGGGRMQTLTDDFGGTSIGRPYTGGALSVAGDRVVYTRSSVDRPADLAVVQRGGRPRVLTDLNGDVLDYKQLGQVEDFWFKSSADGLDVQAWLVKPPQYREGQRYPLLLEIHGGPFAAYGPSFAAETQLYASAGYAVLYVNPRGSTGYGQAFADHIHHNYPGRDYDDLMSAVDTAIAQGVADPDQLYVTGGSGGGTLTAWIVGHTDRFKAAVVAKPVIDWTSFVLTADMYPYFTQYWFPGPPWEAFDHYWKRSPLAYVGNVTTPTMLITGEDDLRTPIPQTEQFYQALKLRRVDTAMLRIPGASHGIGARPTETLNQVLGTLGWMERYRSQPRGATPASGGNEAATP